ncbi:MAG TPA: hypothetical protein VI818_01945 [Candidatus Thermoplasmatota archaeon]|nr:hypothetical protein [Candidatus Thermoplasmatota archaeon]
MGAPKIIGIILIVLAVPLFLGAIVFLFSEVRPVEPFVQDDPAKTGYGLAGIGVLFLTMGVILLLVGPRGPRIPKGAAVAAAQPQQVEIKRTEMNWGSGQTAAPSDQLQEALDDVNRKIGQAKVQFGMGQLSNESYKILMAQYERERGVIEAQIVAQRG